MTDYTDPRSPEDIERDIRATQQDMSDTVEQLQSEFTGRNLFNSLLDKADENGVDARYLIDAARRNPLALGMIALGGIWLVSDADARPSALKISSGRAGGDDSDHGVGDWHSEHRTYIDHMARCEQRPDEDDASYRRRRNHNRASYFMLERGHDEDEHSFHQRLDDATEKLRERRDKATESVRNFASQSRDQAQHAAAKAQGLYHDNPLISGLAAAFVGAIASSALPSTRVENHYIGGVGETALDTAKAGLHQASEEALHQKDRVLDQVDNALGS
ncbi:DUF3618 domain-containing protein [Blastomonas sp.]|uniref:DUF3618 domain-containing protein n=1 Tax=Blastomonas sp. TaxID=1909299 RepID=UPI00261FB3F9|nr:DUF3618 domain-containing protein [Blastomonas sp.]MDM7955733.1 DUF3618 domain-containing protein [Blastomonas sp.]